MLFSIVTPISWVYLPFCLPKCIFLPSTPYPQPHPHPRLQKCLSLFTCLSVCPPVCLSACPSVCFSVCIRKQVRITRKFHNHCDDKTQYTDSHTTARKHSKLISQFSGSFPQQNDCKTTLDKITTNFTTELEDNTITSNKMRTTRNNELTTT